MGVRVAVTGADGFVGNCLCEQLHRDGFKVSRIVRAQADLSTDAPLEALLQGIEIVVHAAARAHVMRETEADALTAYRRVNVDGTLRLARAASRVGVRRFLFLSSIGVLGVNSGNSVFRESDLVAPTEPYAVSKWEAEQALAALAESSQLELTILRPPLVYGPGTKGNFLRLLKLAQSGIPLPLASVNNRRSLIYVRNLASALVRCITHSVARGQTFLVSDGEDISTPELIRRMAAMLDRPARLFRAPLPLIHVGGRMLGKLGDIDKITASLQVDSSLIRQKLDWAPPFSLEQGLAETARWYRALTDCQSAGSSQLPS